MKRLKHSKKRKPKIISGTYFKLNLLTVAIVSTAFIIGIIIYYARINVTAQTTSDTTPPVMIMTSPADGSLVERNGTARLAASYSDASPIWIEGNKSVDFYANGKVICRTASYFADYGGYYCLWAVPAKPDITYAITAQAYDQAGNLGISSLINVIAVDAVQISPTPTTAPLSDTTPPVITIISPKNGDILPRATSFNLAATYSDASLIRLEGNKSFDFYANGKVICRTATYNDQYGGYTCLWGVPSKPNATYTITAKAYDIANNLGISSPITIISSN